MLKILSFNFFDGFPFQGFYKMLFWAVLESEVCDLRDQDQFFVNLTMTFLFERGLVLKLLCMSFDVFSVKAV